MDKRNTNKVQITDLKTDKYYTQIKDTNKLKKACEKCTKPNNK